MLGSLRLALDEVEKLHAEMRDLPVLPSLDVEAARKLLRSQFTFDSPQPIEPLIHQAAQLLREGSLHVIHPRYFGLFNPGVFESSMAGELLATGFNNQLASHTHSPAAIAIEEHTLNAIASKFGWPEGGLHCFTSGGSEANLTGTLVALTHQFPGYRQGGLQSLSKRPCFYSSREAHDSFSKIAHNVGLGREALHVVPVLDNLLLDVAALQRQIEQDRADGWLPFMVVATAGTTSAGIIDPMPEIADLCEREGLWMHVDAAWGGAAVLSPKLRPAMAGIERADSITSDAHKWFSVNMTAGMAFCRHRQSVLNTFGVDASYMPPSSDSIPDPFVSTLQWTRRCNGLKLFLTLAEKGFDGYAKVVEHQAAMGDLLRQKLLTAGWQIVNRTPLPTVCFTYDGMDFDSLGTVLDKVYEKRDVWISRTVLNQKTPALRATITHYDVNEGDLDYLVAAVERARLAM